MVGLILSSFVNRVAPDRFNLQCLLLFDGIGVAHHEGAMSACLRTVSEDPLEQGRDRGHVVQEK